MNLRQLRYVCGIAEAGFNISRAAAALHTSQPGISKQVRLLEEELGVQLLRRRGNRIEGFTAAGLEILATARRMIDDAQNVRRIAEEFQHAKKRLVLATTHIHARYVLRSVIGRFIRRHPEVQLVLRQGSPTQIARWVVAGEADLGITSEPPQPVDDLVMLACARLERSIIVPAGHALAGSRRPTLKRVSAFPILTLDQSYVGGSSVLRAFDDAGIVPDVVLSATDADVIKSYVELGLGIAILPSIAFEAARDRGLRALDARHLFPPAITQIELRRGTWLHGALYDFVAMLAPQWDRVTIEGRMREVPPGG